MQAVCSINYFTSILYIIIHTSCTANELKSKCVTKSFIFKINLTVVINIWLEHEDEQIWHKNKNKTIKKWTGLSVSGHQRFQLYQFKIEGYNIQNCILRSVVKRLIWMIFVHSNRLCKIHECKNQDFY
jgi:hypothetical protein